MIVKTRTKKIIIFNIKFNPTNILSFSNILILLIKIQYDFIFIKINENF